MKNGKPHWTNVIRLHPERLDLPARWKKPRKIFVNSMSDLFHEKIPNDFIRQVYQTMLQVNRHVYLVLTKRPDRMVELLTNADWWRGPVKRGKAYHVWNGVSCEDQETADLRIPLLGQIGHGSNFLSLEPLIGGIDLSQHLLEVWDLNTVVPKAFEWVIIGGESGTNARPCHLEWIVDIVDQCQFVGIRAFVKQLGSNPMLMGEPYAKRSHKGSHPHEIPLSIRVKEYPNFSI